jgi:hypothetical protein
MNWGNSFFISQIPPYYFSGSVEFLFNEMKNEALEITEGAVLSPHAAPVLVDDEVFLSRSDCM